MYPPLYPEPYDSRRPPRPEWDFGWDLSPTDVSATVLGVDSCGGIIIRVQRAPCSRPPRKPERPCDRPPRCR